MPKGAEGVDGVPKTDEDEGCEVDPKTGVDVDPGWEVEPKTELEGAVAPNTEVGGCTDDGTPKTDEEGCELDPNTAVDVDPG